jgi:glycine cleavage system H lipoate-binding protein
MESIMSIIESVGVFLSGMLARAGFVLAAVLVLAVPILIVAYSLHGARLLRERSLGLRHVAGLVVRPDLWYAPGHTWLARRGRTLAMGLDDLARRLMPAVTAVEVRPAGTRVRRGEPVATIHAGARSLDIPAPLDGVVMGPNAAVLRDPSLVKRDGYGRGWLVALRPEGEGFTALPSGAAAERFMREESARWNRFVEGRLGFAAADGGELVAPAPWLLGDAGWRALSEAFLRPA